MSIAEYFGEGWREKIAGDFAIWEVHRLYEFALLDTDTEKVLGIIPTTKDERQVLKQSAIFELERRQIPRERWKCEARQNSALN